MCKGLSVILIREQGGLVYVEQDGMDLKKTVYIWTMPSGSPNVLTQYQVPRDFEINTKRDP